MYYTESSLPSCPVRPATPASPPAGRMSAPGHGPHNDVAHLCAMNEVSPSPSRRAWLLRLLPCPDDWSDSGNSSTCDEVRVSCSATVRRACAPAISEASCADAKSALRKYHCPHNEFPVPQCCSDTVVPLEEPSNVDSEEGDWAAVRSTVMANGGAHSLDARPAAWLTGVVSTSSTTPASKSENDDHTEVKVEVPSASSRRNSTTPSPPPLFSIAATTQARAATTAARGRGLPARLSWFSLDVDLVRNSRAGISNGGCVKSTMAYAAQWTPLSQSWQQDHQQQQLFLTPRAQLNVGATVNGRAAAWPASPTLVGEEDHSYRSPAPQSLPHMDTGASLSAIKRLLHPGVAYPQRRRWPSSSGNSRPSRSAHAAPLEARRLVASGGPSQCSGLPCTAAHTAGPSVAATTASVETRNSAWDTRGFCSAPSTALKLPRPPFSTAMELSFASDLLLSPPRSPTELSSWAVRYRRTRQATNTVRHGSGYGDCTSWAPPLSSSALRSSVGAQAQQQQQQPKHPVESMCPESALRNSFAISMSSDVVDDDDETGIDASLRYASIYEPTMSGSLSVRSAGLKNVPADSQALSSPCVSALGPSGRGLVVSERASCVESPRVGVAETKPVTRELQDWLTFALAYSGASCRVAAGAPATPTLRVRKPSAPSMCTEAGCVSASCAPREASTDFLLDVHRLQVRQKSVMAAFQRELVSCNVAELSPGVHNAWAQVTEEKQLLFHRENDRRLLLVLELSAVVAKLRAAETFGYVPPTGTASENTAVELASSMYWSSVRPPGLVVTTTTTYGEAEEHAEACTHPPLRDRMSPLSLLQTSRTTTDAVSPPPPLFRSPCVLRGGLHNGTRHKPLPITITSTVAAPSCANMHSTATPAITAATAGGATGTATVEAAGTDGASSPAPQDSAMLNDTIDPFCSPSTGSGYPLAGSHACSGPSSLAASRGWLASSVDRDLGSASLTCLAALRAVHQSGQACLQRTLLPNGIYSETSLARASNVQWGVAGAASMAHDAVDTATASDASAGDVVVGSGVVSSTQRGRSVHHHAEAAAYGAESVQLSHSLGGARGTLIATPWRSAGLEEVCLSPAAPAPPPSALWTTGQYRSAGVPALNATDSARFWGQTHHLISPDFSGAVRLLQEVVQQHVRPAFSASTNARCGNPSPHLGQDSGLAHLRYSNGDTYDGYTIASCSPCASATPVADVADAARPGCEGCRHGLGLYNFARDGVAFFGEWACGRPHGDGVLLLVDGLASDGEEEVGGTLQAEELNEFNPARTPATRTRSRAARARAKTFTDGVPKRSEAPVAAAVSHCGMADNASLQRRTLSSLSASDRRGSAVAWPTSPFPRLSPSTPPVLFESAAVCRSTGQGCSFEVPRPPPPMIVLFGQWRDGRCVEVHTMVSNQREVM